MRRSETLISLIGFGEVGSILGMDLACREGTKLQCYDILLDDPSQRDALCQKAKTSGVELLDTLEDALKNAQIVISAVTAENSLDAARNCSKLLGAGQVYLDINSVSPLTKQQACAMVESSGADYIDVAVMAPVPPTRLGVPLLLGGVKADDIAVQLNRLGMNAKTVSRDVGKASAIKMCRSVMIKGIEALTLECLSGAYLHGVQDQVLNSLHASFPSLGWNDLLPDYLISRIAEHGERRSAEMHEVAKMLEEAGIAPRMSFASAHTQMSLVTTMKDRGVTYASLQPFHWEKSIVALGMDEKDHVEGPIPLSEQGPHENDIINNSRSHTHNQVI